MEAVPSHLPGIQVKNHRRRIKIEEKAKVVASVWGEEFFRFLAALADLPRAIFLIIG